ncbi:MAG: methyltransferase [Wenzhouxiangella sp.]|jgi:methylene-fatty-acyl-phospholipid synthase|nr:methyltransferase [Wenzhouxiangella sp.]
MLFAALLAAGLLAIERVSYVLVWRDPDRFRRWVGDKDPVDALKRLFLLFKAIQLSVFAVWIIAFSESFPPRPTAPPVWLTLGIALIIGGQVLNFGVFWRLGKVGVFYGNKLGHEVPWVQGFPFSLVPHPQYIGTLLSIWGLFLTMRFPHPDWMILPLVSTVYYLLAMRLER